MAALLVLEETRLVTVVVDTDDYNEALKAAEEFVQEHDFEVATVFDNDQGDRNWSERYVQRKINELEGDFKIDCNGNEIE